MKALLIDGSGASSRPIIDAGGGGSVVIFESGEGAGSVLRGFKLVGGSGTPVGFAPGPVGGGIWIDGAAPRIEHTQVRGNDAWYGGGVAVYGGAAPVLRDCDLSGNTAAKGGGLFVRDAGVVLFGGRIRYNQVDHPQGAGAGGGVHVDQDATLSAKGVRFEGNGCPLGRDGGGLRAEPGALSVVLESCDFVENWPGTYFGVGSGGAISAAGPLLATRGAPDQLTKETASP